MFMQTDYIMKELELYGGNMAKGYSKEIMEQLFREEEEKKQKEEERLQAELKQKKKSESHLEHKCRELELRLIEAEARLKQVEEKMKRHRIYFLIVFLLGMIALAGMYAEGMNAFIQTLP